MIVPDSIYKSFTAIVHLKMLVMTIRFRNNKHFPASIKREIIATNDKKMVNYICSAEEESPG